MRAAALAAVGLALAGPAAAQDATWNTVPGSGDYNNPTNWTPTIVPTGTAFFGTSTITSLSLSDSASVGGWTFDAGASAYSFSVNRPLDFTGAGIVINGGSAAIAINLFSLSFDNASTAGSASITNNNSVLNFNNTSRAGSATITNSRFLNFRATSTAGSAAITNSGLITFSNNSTAGTASITNPGGINFTNASTAGSAIINNNNDGAVLTFRDTSTAGSATIANKSFRQFTDTSTAGSANITNSGSVRFDSNSTAGSATITNNSLVQFSPGTTAGSATITNNSSLIFIGTARNFTTAGNAAITNNDRLVFDGTSTAGNAAITNAAGGAVVDFSRSTGPGNDHKLSAGSIAGSGQFYLGADQLTVGSNNLSTTVNGVISDCGAAGIACLNQHAAGGALVKTGAGTLTLSGANSYTGATTISAGTLALTGVGTMASSSGVVANGAFDISGVTGTGTSIKTLSGSGSVALGTKTLTLTNASGNFAGVVNGAGGFTLAGGAETLSGANTYTGGTTISAGTLQLGNGGATGSIVGNVLDNGTFVFNRSDTYTFNGIVSGSGAIQQNGSGTTILTGANTYTGATTISAGTLTIAAGGSISSSVTNSATFNNSGAVAGSVSNSGTFNNNAGGTVSGQLTNTAGTTTNAGQLNGGANVTGGTLTTTGTISGGLTNSATVNAAGIVNGPIANNAGTFTTTGALSSNSSFGNAAGATLAVGTDTWTLQGLLTNSGALTVASGATLDARAGGITNTASGTITVAAGGTVKDDLTNAGVVSNAGAYVANVATNTGAGSITNSATGSWTGNVLSNAATITNNGVWTGNVASNTGTITNNLTWTGTVSNAGTFNNNAGATVSGLLTNTAGVTTNSGTLGGGALISGGALTGAGSVSNLTIANGGMFAPGNGSPGSSMTVAGNLAFQSGALYLVQLNPATSSSTSVTGTATLGNASVNAMFANGSYVSKQYTILTANGGVAGAFGGLVNTDLPANFHTTLSYDANHAYLNLILNFAIPGGLNGNQQAVGNALTNFFNSNGSIPLVYSALTANGLTQASGELATASQQSTFDAMNLFLGLLTDPFVAGRGEPVASPAVATQFADEDDVSAYASSRKPRSKSERDAYAAVYRKAPVPADPFVQRWSVWSAGYGGSQTTDGNAVVGSNNTRSSIGGVAVGADYRFSQATLAGFAIAGGATGFSVNGLGTGRSDLFQAGAFVRHNNGPAYVSAALAYGWQDIITDRTVTIASADLLRARFNANAFSGRLEGGYRFVTPSMAMGLTPYAAGQFTTFDLPAYAEQAIAGANTFALAYGANSVTASRSELGLRSDKSFAMENGIFTLRGRAAWAHNFNPDRTIAATFQTLPGASFVVNGAAQAADSALVTGSAEMKWLNGISLAATFEGEFSGVTRSYAGKGVARYAW